jgi:SH3 domain protein
VKKFSNAAIALILMAFWIGDVAAKTVYVTDNLELPLRSSETTKGKIISLLATGTPLTVIEENSKTGFSKVRLQNGMEGYISTRNTMPELPNRILNNPNAKILEQLQTENSHLKEEMAKVKATLVPGSTLEQSLASDRDRLERELTEIRKSAANQIQIKDERDDLQEQVINAKRELEQLKLENHALKDGANQDWFLYGGILALAGVLLGFILPKIGWRRKNSWDSF